MYLSKAEEQLMEYVWKLEKAFLRDLIDSLPEPKLAAATVATLLKRMSDKGFVGYKLYGNSREYYPLVEKSDYFAQRFKGVIETSFSDSTLQLASFLTKATNMTAAELQELRNIVDQEIEKKKNDTISD